MTVVFWNTNGKDVGSELVSLVDELDADLLALAECETPLNDVLRALNSAPRATWNATITTVPTKTVLFVRGASTFVKAIFDLPRASVREVAFPSKPPFFMVLVHLASRLHYTEEDQATEAIDVADVIRQVEKDAGHTRTIVVGDFNMNPFSAGLTSARSFNAVLTQEIASREHRVKAGTKYPFFFNPMWSHFGDRNDTAPGTFYYSPPGYESLYWHMFDQVLLRPRMFEYLHDTSVKIVTRCGARNLHDKNGRPGVSDHFPISLSLNY